MECESNEDEEREIYDEYGEACDNDVGTNVVVAQGAQWHDYCAGALNEKTQYIASNEEDHEVRGLDQRQMLATSNSNYATEKHINRCCE